MNTLVINIIGYTAALVGTTLMIPQVVKSFKTKSVKDISLFMVIAYVLNCILWTIYGFFIVSYPVIICNIIAFVISIIQLILKIKYTKKI